MLLSSTQTVPASVEATWLALNDPAILKECVPGCEEIELTGDNQYAVRLRAKVGPVSAKFAGRMTITDMQPPHAYSLTFEGQGGVAGFAKGSAHVTLAEDGPAATLMTYEVEALVGGKLAQIGARLIDSAARKLADDFFATFVEKMRQAPAAT